MQRDAAATCESYRVEVNGRFEADGLLGRTSAIRMAWAALIELELLGVPSGTEVSIIEDRTNECRAGWRRRGSRWCELPSDWLH